LSLGHDPTGRAAKWLRRQGFFFLVLALVPRPAIAAKAAATAASPVAAEAAADVVAEEAPDANGDERLLLEVQVNGHSIGKIGEFTLHYGTLMARPQELHDLGFRVPASLIPGPGGLIALSGLPGLTWSVDLKNQVLRVTARDSALLPTLLLPEGREGVGSRRVVESGTGVTLNYDLSGSFAAGLSGGSGALGLRAFSPRGIISSNWLGYAGATQSASGKNTAVRLDSAYTFADVNTLRRYTVGDFITSGLSWTRPVHFEGAQILSDFSTRPDLITFPLPRISGSAAVPSTVEVLTNGNQVMTRQIDAGPFEIPELPVVSGAGTISMTVTNALGQQVSVSQPFYATPTLLKPGLQTFAVDAGLVRRFWGSYSNDDGKMAGTAIYRRGLTRKLTVEGSFEETPGAATGGAGGVFQIGHLGVVNFAAAASSGAGTTSEQYSVGAQRIGRVFSVGASAIIAGRNFRDVAAMNGAAVPRRQLNGNASLFLKRFGSIGGVYAELDQDNSPHPVPAGSTTAQHSKVFTANYSRQLHRISIYANEFKYFGSTGSNNGFQAGIIIPFGKRSSASASGSSDKSGEVQVQKSAPQVGDWGYAAYVAAGNSTHEFAQMQYKSHVGLFTAGVDESAGQTTVRLESQGALSFIDKRLFPSNYIYDSFAIVDTHPVARVRVYQENRPVGITNRSGRLLVPDMRSYDLNHIAIEPTDIPPDATLSDDKRTLRPRDLSGVVIKFPIKFNHAALLKLVDEAGASLPVGSTATLRASGAIVPVGFDGQAYVEELSSHNEVTVERPNGRKCMAVFDYKPLPGDIPSIGPLLCQEKTK
jgi:outer membrane usher protein